MPGRPADPNLTSPSYTTRTFAPDANYPAGSQPWNGQATKVEPAGAASVGFTPDTGAAAEEVNKLFSDAYAQDAASKSYETTLRNEAQTALSNIYAFAGIIPILNWLPESPPASPNMNGGFYAKGSRRWYVFGNSGDVRESLDHGYSWSASTLLSGVAAGTETCLKGDSDTSGNVVIATQNGAIFQRTASSGVWTKVVTFGGSLHQDVAFDPVSGLWATVRDEGTTAQIMTSSNRTAWGAQSPPAGWNDWTTYPAMGNLRICSNKAGRIVVVGQGYDALGPAGAGLCRAMASNDGGVTWTDGGTFATTIASPTTACLVYDDVTATWMYTIGEQSGTHSSEVWTSADGLTWTKKATLANYCLQSVAPFGASWVGIATESGTFGHIVFSLDAGATWQFAGVRRTASGGAPVPAIAAGGGGLMAIMGGNTLRMSVRATTPSLGSLT